MWKSIDLHGKLAHAPETPYVDKTASNAWVTHGELFTETTVFMAAVQSQVVRTCNYKKYVLKDPILLTTPAANIESNQKPFNI